jgi:hypothetical protein
MITFVLVGRLCFFRFGKSNIFNILIVIRVSSNLFFKYMTFKEKELKWELKNEGRNSR